MKLFKKLAAIALVAVMALAMVGCYSAPAGATLNDKQATALAALVKTDREAAGKKTELKRSTEAEAILADYAKAMVDYFSNRTDETNAAGLAAAQKAMRKLSQLTIDGKQIDMNQSMMAIGIGDNGPVTPSDIKAKAQKTMTKVEGGEFVEKDTWTPVINADGSYLAVVWAEKDGATAVIVMNIVLK